VQKAAYELEQSSYRLTENAIKREVALAYQQLLYQREKYNVYRFLDSIYKDFSRAAERKFELGETNYLEKISARSKQTQLFTLLKQADEDLETAYSRLRTVVQSDSVFTLAPEPFRRLRVSVIDPERSLGSQFYEQKLKISEASKRFYSQELLPDISFNYFMGTNSGLNTSLNGYTVGLKIPVLFSGNASKIKAAKIQQDIAEREIEDFRVKIKEKYFRLLSELKKYEEALNYYEEEGSKLSEEIIKTAQKSFQNGEIDFFQYLQSLENANNVILFYLDNLYKYNQTVIKINHLSI
jgi:cobalt-zinc-cadmium resistance protein CzcA